MHLRKAVIAEFPAVKQFYDQLIDDMEGMTYHPKWQKGIYPEYSYLEESIRNGELYITVDADAIIGAMILSHNTNDGYSGITWNVDAKPEEVTIIHTLGVAASRARTGVGKFMVQETIRLAKEVGQKALRLDVLVGNLPAYRLYEGIGFVFIKRVNMFYEDTGWCDFDLYEYAL